jgi:hypothetical protein
VYRGPCGGCPVDSFIRASDYTSAMEGMPVRRLMSAAIGRPSYIDVGIAALRRALVRAESNVYDERTIALLICLQNCPRHIRRLNGMTVCCRSPPN